MTRPTPILRYATALTVALATSGCATALRFTEPATEPVYEANGEQNAAGVDVTLNDVGPRRPFLGWREVAGWAADGYVMANASAAAMTYQTIGAANQYLVLFVAGGLAADLGASWLLGALRQAPAQLSYMPVVDGKKVQGATIGLGDAGSGRYLASIPASKLVGASQVDLAIKDGGGRTIWTGKLAVKAVEAPKVGEDVSKVVEAKAPTSDVDTPPAAGGVQPDDDRFALVIGVENYQKLPPVTFARHDAAVIERYFHKVLGVPMRNTYRYLDGEATRTAITAGVAEKLKARVIPGKSELFVYFAGHGSPNKGGAPSLLPFDADVDAPNSTFLPTDTFYAELHALGAKRVTVFLDACFTGGAARSTTGQALDPNARPVRLVEKASPTPSGVTVFAAAGPNQASNAYVEKGHGLFTYFLLKTLRDEKVKDLTVRKLEGILTREVAEQAAREHRQQTPVLQDGRDKDHPLVEVKGATK